MRAFMPGDTVILRDKESGLTWVARVDRVTRSGRVLCWWVSVTISRVWKSKPRAVDPSREEIVRAADVHEIAEFDIKAKAVEHER